MLETVYYVMLFHVVFVYTTNPCCERTPVSKGRAVVVVTKHLIYKLDYYSFCTQYTINCSIFKQCKTTTEMRMCN